MNDNPPRRRWFQFSLTSLLVMMTLVAIWLAWELSFIRERQTWLRENAALVEAGQGSAATGNLVITVSGDLNLSSTTQLVLPVTKPSRIATIPWWRGWLGDKAVPTITDPGFSEEVRAETTRLFPEAEFFTVLLPQFTGTVTYTLDKKPAEKANEPNETPK